MSIFIVKTHYFLSFSHRVNAETSCQVSCQTKLMIISTLVNDIRSEDHVCLSPLSVQKTQIPASQKLLKMPVE
jgi:hypothetical protein